MKNNTIILELISLLLNKEHENKITDDVKIADDDFVNRYVIIRSYDSGVHFGILLGYDKVTRHARLKDSRRLHTWYGFTLTAVANKGMRKDKNAFVSEVCPDILVGNVCEIIPCSDMAIKNLSEYHVHKTENDVEEN